jgi:hypothetical protein
VTWQKKEKPMTAALPDIHLTEIAQQSDGAGIQEIASAIMDAIYHDVTQTVSGKDMASEKGPTEPHEPAGENQREEGSAVR